MSSSEESVPQNVLYKVYVRSSRNIPIDRSKLHHMLLTVAEPFKVFVHESNSYGFVYFGCKRDALACIGAFNEQPPYYYKMQMAIPDIHVMTPKEINKMNELIKRRAQKLKEIELQMRELKVEHSRIRCSLGDMGLFSGSESGSDVLEELSFEEPYNDNYRRSRSRSRPQLQNENFTITVKRGKSLDKSKASRQSLNDLDYSSNNQLRRDKSMDRQSQSQRDLNHSNNYQSSQLRRDKSTDRQSLGQRDFYHSNNYQSSQFRRDKSTDRQSLGQREFNHSNNYQSSQFRRDKSTDRSSGQRDRNGDLRNKNLPQGEYYNVPQNRPPRDNISGIRDGRRQSTNQEFNNKFNKSTDQTSWDRQSIASDFGNTLKQGEFVSNEAVESSSKNTRDSTDRNISMRRNKTPAPTNEFNTENSSYSIKDKEIGTSNVLDNEKTLSSRKTTVSKSFDGERRCIVNLLAVEQTGGLKIKTIYDASSCTAQCTVSDFVDQINIVQNLWEKYSENNIITPHVGDFVCVEYDDDWSRGYVLSKADDNNTWRVRLIDEGVEILSSKICKLLPEHISVPELACKCHVIKIFDEDKFKSYFLPNKTLGFTVEKIDDNGEKVFCVLKDRKSKSAICEMNLSRWHSKDNSNEYINEKLNDENVSDCTAFNIPKPKLVSGCMVVIANVESQKSIFVKCRESSQNLQKINELMSAYGSTLPPFNGTLSVGQCVAAKFSEDGLWYRAVIRKLSANNQTAEVLYIDYGNGETVDTDDIRKLLEPMYEIPRVLVDVKLKGLPDSPLSVAQIKYFEKCVESKTKFKMMFDDLESDVTLISLNDNVNLNERLVQLSTCTIPSPPLIEDNASRKSISVNERTTNINETNKLSTSVNTKTVVNNENKPKATAPKETPTLESNNTVKENKEDATVIKMEELPLGKTELIFENIMDVEDKILICYKNDLKALTYVQNQLTQDLFEYIEKFKPKPFTPCEGGSCIAKFEGDWYRAVCLKVEQNSALVLFVDFGNYEYVTTADIRALPQEFSTAPGIALICTLTDVPISITSDKFPTLLERGEIYSVEVLEKEEEGQYRIRMPHILAAI